MSRYFTGKHCKHGHVDKRNVSSRTCYACNRDDTRRWAAANTDKITAKTARRRAAKRNATPAEANQDAISAIYADVPGIADLLGESCSCDHHIPLSAGGLHHENNLVIMTAAANMSKGAKVPGVNWFAPPLAFEQVTYRTTRGDKN